MQGDSMAEWCLGNRGPENSAVYLGLGGITRKPGWRAVWDGRYIYAPLGYNPLYDHQTDPYEIHNRIDDPEYAAVKKRMAGLLVDLAQKTDDPLLPQVKAACSA